MNAIAIQRKKSDKAVKAAATLEPEPQRRAGTQTGATAGVPQFMHANRQSIAVEASPSSASQKSTPQIQRQVDKANKVEELGLLQAKLTVGVADDPLEQEADRVADQVLAEPAHPVVSGATPSIQRFTGQGTGNAGAAPASVDRVLSGSGRPLDPDLQQEMGQRFGHDFSRVRVHSGSAAEQSAQDVDANAYTAGHNIVFGAGRFAPGTYDGRRLIAHELTHVVQQHGSLTAGQTARPLQLQRDRVRESDEERLQRLARAASRMEQRAELTSEQAESVQGAIDASLSSDEADRAQLSERARSVQEYLRYSRRALREGRRDGRLVSDLEITPQIIRIDQGEAARISFRVRAPQVSGIDAYIMERRTEGGGYRFFNFSRSLTPGHKVAIWDGLWDGQRNRPPQTGTYPLYVSVRTPDGQQEELRDNVRVENSTQQTVLPRSRSGLAVQGLWFDGHYLELRDAEGNVLRMRAASGLRPRNPRSGGRDWTGPEHQWTPNRGPLPAGTYSVEPGHAQRPEGRGSTPRYPTGGRASAWGPFRVWLNPNQVGNRSQFFIHLDVTGDGTAGCVGVDPADEGQFNLLFSILFGLDVGTKVPVHVRY